jgi:Rps23 Pro-64 3,4-dihydroxylase Tpa1-like proline 4-hydroxylase
MGTINLAETSLNVLVFNNTFFDNIVDKRGGALAIYATIAGAQVSILSNKFSTNKFVIIVVLLLLLFDCFF